MSFGWWIAILAGAYLMGSILLRRATDLPPGDDDGTLVRLAESGHRIEAVRRYRARHGGGLKDAKEAVERLALGERVEPPVVSPVHSTLEIDTLIREGRQLEAIKAYREAHPEADLLVAKEAVEVIAKRMGLKP